LPYAFRHTVRLTFFPQVASSIRNVDVPLRFHCFELVGRFSRALKSVAFGGGFSANSSLFSPSLCNALSAPYPPRQFRRRGAPFSLDLFYSFRVSLLCTLAERKEVSLGFVLCVISFLLRNYLSRQSPQLVHQSGDLGLFPRWTFPP